LDKTHLEDTVRFVEMTAHNGHSFLELTVHDIEETDHVLVVDEPTVH
jgi:hypothetical protein